MYEGKRIKKSVICELAASNIFNGKLMKGLRGMTDTKQRGRPKQFRNAAEKQKAYRERQKADSGRFELANYMLDLIEERAQALRNSVSYWREKGHELEIVYSHFGSGHVQTLKGGYHNGSCEVIVFQYLLRRGELVEVIKRPFGDIVYRMI